MVEIITNVIFLQVKHSTAQYIIHGTENSLRAVGYANEVGDKHGFSEADICRAIRTGISEALIDEYEDKYAIIGFDSKGNALEILYNFLDDETMEVYHAMRCRKSFRKKYGTKGECHGC